MKIEELGALYVLVGSASALVMLVRGGGGRAVWLDACLLLLFWPLHGPFLLLARVEERSAPARESGDDHGLLQALRRAEGTPLASLLPDEATGLKLARRLDLAREKVEEIDALLLLPEFSEEAAHDRQRELEARGDMLAASSAQGRVQHIRRLRALRDRSERELNEVGELIAQLRIQAAVVRLTGADDGTRDLVSELMNRIEGLDAVLDA